MNARRPLRNVVRTQRANQERRGRLAVFAPSPLLTITIEPGSGQPEVHLHPGGQGFWVARLAVTLGAQVAMCCSLGGEAGTVLKALLESEALGLRVADGQSANGVYIHDRRSGERVEVVNVDGRPLSRHAADELYGIALAAGLEADVTLLTGCQPIGFVEASAYRRLASDLRTNGKLVIADLTGPPLWAALEGGIDLLRLSADELVGDQLAAGFSRGEIVQTALRLREAGAQQVLISRASEPAVLIDGGAEHVYTELAGPAFEAVDHHGTGDSMFAAIGVGLATGKSTIDALRLGMAAGALNATRRGLGTGTREEIERLTSHVLVSRRPVSIGLEMFSRREAATSAFVTGAN
ncbi:MAG: hypothetical protein JO153_04215 [Solirubrobacterales bacterium]|nr:hypothetical protein [Solirubrobacterales bacterium]